MRNVLMTMLFISIASLNACSSLHDHAGWEHEGDAETHEDSTPYLFEHKH